MTRTLRNSTLLLLLAVGAAVAQPAEEADPLAPQPDPVVEAIVDAPRTAPADYARTVFVLIDLGQTERAAPILRELVALQLDDDALAKLVREFGSARFLKLANTRALGDDAATLAERCLAAAAAQATDPQRLATLVERLGADSRSERGAALADLRTTGAAGAAYVLNELAAAGQRDAPNRLRRTLVDLAPTSTPLLLAALDADNDQLAAQAAIALGEIGEEQAAPLLAVQTVFRSVDSPAVRAAAWGYEQLTGQPFDFGQLANVTGDAIDRTLNGGPPFVPDADGSVTLGRWDAAAGRVVTTTLPESDARVVLAAKFAKARAGAFADRSDYRRLALVLGLESDGALRAAGVEADELQELLELATPADLSAALSEAVADGRHRAAVALCGSLAERGGIGVLATVDGRPAPLAAALDAAHPAVRFAALEALMTLGPTPPFPGSSRVAPALAYFAAAEGDTRAVVAMPNLERSATLAGRLNGAQVEATVTNRGCEAVELADAGADVSLVFVDMAILDPGVRETLFRLRRQPASAGVPIALTAGDGRLADAKRIADEHQRVLAVPRPHSATVAAEMAEELTALLPPDWPDAEARARNAEQAREWIAKLAKEGPDFYGVRE